MTFIQSDQDRDERSRARALSHALHCPSVFPSEAEAAKASAYCSIATPPRAVMVFAEAILPMPTHWAASSVLSRTGAI